MEKDTGTPIYRARQEAKKLNQRAKAMAELRIAVAGLSDDIKVPKHANVHPVEGGAFVDAVIL